LARALVAALAVLGTAACGSGGVPDRELPDAPLAVALRSPEDSRRRAELLAEQDAKAREPAPSALPQVPRVKDVARYLSGVMRGTVDEPAAAQRFSARLALLDPRDRSVERLTGAWPAAVPQAWSGDRRRLLFSQLVDEYAQLFELDRTSGEVRAITHGPDVHPAGCHGPDGRFVLMTARVVDDEVQSQIELTEPGGGRGQPISPGPRDYAPSCSPDASAVVYVSAPSRDVEWLMLLELNGSREPRRLGPGRQPRFCGNGEWIVYSAPIQRGTRIWRVRPDGTGRAPIGRGVLDEREPTCSPDGRFVVYGVEQEHRENLYVRRFDGSGDRLLWADSDAASPVW
jgi:Tol biopolymer transport system component